MKKSENFWNRNAKRYDRFMRKDRAAYEKLYELIRPVVKARTVLELAAGTGLIAKNIVRAASAHRGDGRLRGDDRRGEAEQPLRKAALFGAGYVLPALCGQVL